MKQKLCKVVQTTLKTHLMKGLFWTVEQWKGTREHETVQKHWTSIGGFLASFNDLNRWFLQHPKSGKKAFISWRSTSSNTHCALNSLDLSLKNREKWRCNLETTDWSVVPGTWVPNPPNADGCTPVAFWGLGFGKVKALLPTAHWHPLISPNPSSEDKMQVSEANNK